MFSDEPDLGEQALSKAAEIGLSTQLDKVDNLEVDVRTNPLKLMQGELESVKIEGEGLVMKQDLRAKELKLEVSDVAINPLKAAFGQIELTHPTEASAEVVLTEQDIERAFNSQYIKDKLQQLPVAIEGEPRTINTRNVKFGLPGAGRVAFETEIEIIETNETKQVAFTAVPRVASNGKQLLLENVEYGEQKETSPELTAALLANASELLDLRNFSMTGMSLKIRSLDVQPGQLRFEGEAQVEQFPS